jgi:hypothetical protein
MPYGIVGSYLAGNNHIFGVMHTTGGVLHARGLSVVANPFLCCGTTAIHSFGSLSLPSFASKAAFLAGLWQNGCSKTHLMYVITEAQAKQTGMEHAALLECGAVKVCEFKNMNHYPYNTLQTFVVNLNDGIDKFFNASGTPFTVEPENTRVVRNTSVTLFAAPAVVAPVAVKVAAPKVKEVNV